MEFWDAFSHVSCPVDICLLRIYWIPDTDLHQGTEKKIWILMDLVSSDIQRFR